MSFSRDETPYFANSSKVFLHSICSQCNASTLRAGPQLHWVAGVLLQKWHPKCISSGRIHWAAQTDRCSLHYVQGKETKVIFHLCSYSWNHPWILSTNRMPDSFTVRAVEQINYLEMVILHASPVESLCTHHCGSLAVPGSLVSNTSPAPPSPCGKGKGISHLSMLLPRQKYPGMPCCREYAAFHGAWQNHVPFVLFYHMVRSSTKENPMDSQSQS